MSKINNVSDVFREAKKHLWDGKRYYGSGHEFICHAIHAVWESPHEFLLAKRAIEIIQHRLGKGVFDENYTVTAYLHHVLGLPYEELTNEKVQKYRKDWLTALEKEFAPKLKPKKGYNIHHVDGDKNNNDLSNLTYTPEVKSCYRVETNWRITK